MKKLVIGLCALFAVSAASAEDMKFVTLLSQPVGSFAKLETLDQGTPSKIFNLNFCNTSVDSGTIKIEGLSYMNQIDVDGNASLGALPVGGVQNYVLKQMRVRAGAGLPLGVPGVTGGRAAIQTVNWGTNPNPLHIESTGTLNYLGSSDSSSGVAGTVDTVVASLNGTILLTDTNTNISNPQNIASSSVGWKNNYTCNYAVKHTPEGDPTVSEGGWTSAGGAGDTCDGKTNAIFAHGGNPKNIPNGSCVDVNGSQKRTLQSVKGSAAKDDIICAPGSATFTSYMVRD